MKIFHTIADLRAATKTRQAADPNHVLGCVPTMGNLHAGHLALVSQAKARSDTVVVTIFVNRLQFLPHEDFDRYPRTLQSDCDKLATLGINPDDLWVFAPDEQALYPEPQTFKVHPPAEIADILEGYFRPGFFVGVSTVVMKLFQAVQPQIAVFGQKDYQQLMVIKQMVHQFALPIEIVTGKTERAGDGLALSSRNGYLSETERAQAVELSQTLKGMRQALLSGACDVGALEAQALGGLQSKGWRVDYITVRRRVDLQAPKNDDIAALLKDGLVIVAAAKLGNTRLIDNLEV